MTGLPLEVDLVIRLIVAGLLGAAVGLEREIHGHPAGLRTHLLVALGAAVFTVLSGHGFNGMGGGDVVDPTRIAAQVVSGIGFLGAGAILKEGFTIRGLTTAASLWVTAAIGMAAGVAQYTIAVAGMAIILISLWPLHPLVDRLERARSARARIVLQVARLGAVDAVRSALEGAGAELAGVRTRRAGPDRFSVEIDVRHASGSDLYTGIAALEGVEGITVARVDQGE